MFTYCSFNVWSQHTAELENCINANWQADGDIDRLILIGDATETECMMGK